MTTVHSAEPRPVDRDKQFLTSVQMLIERKNESNRHMLKPKFISPTEVGLPRIGSLERFDTQSEERAASNPLDLLATSKRVKFKLDQNGL